MGHGELFIVPFLGYNPQRFIQRTLNSVSVFRFLKYACGVLILAALTACGSAPAVATPSPTATPHLPVTVVDAIRPSATPTPVSRAITLTLWLPTAFNAEPVRSLLHQQLDAFATSEDGVPIEVLIKSDHGPGGLYDLLKTASPVAPSILPDLIALDAGELEAAARLGLLQPIGPLLPADFVGDFFPFARDLGTINGTLYGLIYAADLEHLAYNTKAVNAAPVSWDQILTDTLTYALALYDADNFVSDSVWANYTALGGTLMVNDQPALDQAVLAQLLDLYQRAQRAAVLSPNVLRLDSGADAWNTFFPTEADLVNVRASLYMSIAQSFPTVQFAALPALDRPALPIGRGWAFALVARDARHQAAAVKLLQWLLTPDNAGALTRAGRVLPGRAAALATWDQTNPYIGFLNEQLTAAHAAPPASLVNVIGPVLHQAIDDVLNGRATPDEAALTAITTLGTKRP